MKDAGKTIEQLTDELVTLRERIAQLEALEARHERAEKDLSETCALGSVLAIEHFAVDRRQNVQ